MGLKEKMLMIFSYTLLKKKAGQNGWQVNEEMTYSDSFPVRGRPLLRACLSALKAEQGNLAAYT